MGSRDGDEKRYVSIVYFVEIPDAQPVRFELRIDPATVLLQWSQPDDLPDWTKLEYQQCPNCPFQSADVPRCPPAVNLVSVIKGFEQVYAYRDAKVTVTTAERTISKQTTMQTAVGSLMGLIMATSGCPHFTFFRPMARYHLPFASPEETVIRAASSYLIARYMLRMEAPETELDLQGLIRVYEEIQTVNFAFADRIRAASKADTAANALVALDVLAQTLPMTIEDSLKDVQYLYDGFLATQRKP